MKKNLSKIKQFFFPVSHKNDFLLIILISKENIIIIEIFRHPYCSADPIKLFPFFVGKLKNIDSKMT